MKIEDEFDVKVTEHKMWEVSTKELDSSGYLSSSKIYRFWREGTGWKLEIINHLNNAVIVTIYVPKKVIDILLNESVKENLKG